MATFKPTIISKEFITAINDAQTSAKAITFDSVVASQTVLTDDATNSLTYASAQQCSQDVTGTVNAYRNQDPNTLIIDSNVNNKSLSNDVKVATLLIYGQYDGKKILIATARLVTNDLLPKFDGSPVTLEYELYLTIQGASNVTINLNEAGLATRKDVSYLDSTAVHNTGKETIDGIKIFIQKIVGNITNSDRSTTSGTADQLKTGNQSVSGNLTVPIDNSMINVGNDADLAMVKKQGQGGTIVVGSGKDFRIQKSNNTKISPTDTLTDIFTVSPDGVVSAKKFNGNANTASVSDSVKINKIARSNANNLINNGFYIFNGDNLPNNINNFYVYIEQYDNDNVKQIAIRDYDNATFIRSKVSGNWSGWEELARIDGNGNISGNSVTSTTSKLQLLPENKNADDITSSGLYGWPNGRLVGLPAYPVWGNMEVTQNAEGDVIQRVNVTNGSSATMYIRTFSSGSWHNWKTF